MGSGFAPVFNDQLCAGPLNGREMIRVSSHQWKIEPEGNGSDRQSANSRMSPCFLALALMSAASL